MKTFNTPEWDALQVELSDREAAHFIVENDCGVGNWHVTELARCATGQRGFRVVPLLPEARP